MITRDYTTCHTGATDLIGLKGAEFHYKSVFVELSGFNAGLKILSRSASLVERDY